MKIFSAEQFRKWDSYTIDNEPISSINLMERAAGQCVSWLENYSQNKSYIIFCGPGNNGGDGLAIARLLHKKNLRVIVYFISSSKTSNDFNKNIERLKEENIIPVILNNVNEILPVSPDVIIIDALFGTGLSKPVEGLFAEVIQWINQQDVTVISIDLPSGLYADQCSLGNPVVHATKTLSFQTSKLAFLLPENDSYTGEVEILDIALSPEFYIHTPTLFSTTELKDVKKIFKPRKNNSHKYNYGHALIYSGSKNMTGAAILCAKACMRSGAGLATVVSEHIESFHLQLAIPEIITSPEKNTAELWQKKNAIAFGPGLENNLYNKELLKEVITQSNLPLVIDATGLALLSGCIELLAQRNAPPTILTPHTGEFEKLFGKTANDFERISLALQQSVQLNCYIILKGHPTFIATPEGKGYFNPTGNPGMATAGSGDVLTGILVSLIAQNYSAEDACLMGVYLHGLAGDIAAEYISQEAMISSDIIENFGKAFQIIKDKL